MRKLSFLVILTLMTVMLPLSAVADETKDIPTNASETGIHDSLVAALAHAGLVTALEGDGPFTVFAPTDDAFTAAGIDLSTFDTDEENATLVDILTYHVVVGETLSSAISENVTEVTAYNGDSLRLYLDNGSAFVNDATIVQADVMSSNGVIHVIDTVLLPPADEEPQGPPGEICYNIATHTIVVGADEATCDAYMYVENYSVGEEEITGCYNTVTHEVTNTTQAICESYMWAPAVDIVMTAKATTIHTTLVAAVETASLDDTLSGDDNFTVFAPTDAAFGAALEALSLTAEELLASEGLSDILLYHVIPGKILSSDIAEGETIVAAANGDNLTIVRNDTGVYVNGAAVTLADVPASNGVIHVIDAVLLPPADETTEVEEDPCDMTISVSSTRFAPTKVTVDVGATVCWSWENADMAHNVREVNGDKSSTYVEGGLYSGAAATTVMFKHTFTENTTFYYVCEPHIGANMFGTVVVGDGGAAEVSPPLRDSEDTPGFLLPTFILAMIGAVLFTRRTNES
jgi:transforming growth factor-beta-induced protein